MSSQRIAMIWNERLLMTARFLNGAGIACVALGFARPIFSAAPLSMTQIWLMCLGVAGGVALHVLARRVLGYMRAED